MRARKKEKGSSVYSRASSFLDSIIGEILNVQTSVQGWMFFAISSMSSPSVIVNALFAPIRVCIGNRNFVPSTGFHSANRSLMAAPSFPFQVQVTKNFMGYTHVLSSLIILIFYDQPKIWLIFPINRWSARLFLLFRDRMRIVVGAKLRSYGGIPSIRTRSRIRGAARAAKSK